MDEVDIEGLPKIPSSPLLNGLQILIGIGIKSLAIAMALVIFWTLADVFYTTYLEYSQSTFLLMDVDGFLKIFGSFLLVLIGIEIFLNIILYLRQDVDHVKLVISTALIAVSRKVIVMDYKHILLTEVLGLGFIILALGITYWLVGKTLSPR